MKKILLITLITLSTMLGYGQTKCSTGLIVGPSSNSNRLTISYIDYTGGVLRIVGGSTNYLVSTKISGISNVTNESKATMFTAPTFTGHPTIESVTSTGATGTGNIVFSASPTFTGSPVVPGYATTAQINDTVTLSTAIGQLNYLPLKPITNTVKNALTPSAGWLIYSSSDGKLEYYNGSTWVQL